MARINTDTITGTLAEEPQVRYSKDGVAHTTISLRSFRMIEQHGEESGTLDRFAVHCSGKLAEHAAVALEDGSEVHITGHLEQRSWVSEGGAAFSTVEIVADEVSLTVAQVLGEVHPSTSSE